MKKLNYSKDRLAEARNIRERWYNNEPVERPPYVFSVRSDVSNAWLAANPYNFQEMCEDSKTAVEGITLSMQYQFDTFPDCDYLPVMPLFYMGEGILAAMYGAEQLVVPHDPPYTKGRVFGDIYEAQKISNDFEIESTFWGRRLKEHVERFVDATNGEIPVGPPDYQSPYGTATKLMPNEELMMAMYSEPELVKKFIGAVTDGIIKLSEAMERWVGSDVYAHNFSNPIPQKCGFMLWDDYISVVTPALHMEFFVPANNLLFERYGYGHLHTCGPYFPSFINPCIACSPRSMDISIMRGMGKTKKDLNKFLEIAQENNIKLFGSPDMNDISVFEKDWRQPDDEMFSSFVRGGWMPAGGGTYEEGKLFIEKVKKAGGVL